jgi:lysophospholipase L1-like esterase
MREKTKKCLVLGISILFALFLAEMLAHLYPGHRVNAEVIKDIDSGEFVSIDSNLSMMYINGSLSQAYQLFGDYDRSRKIIAVIGDSYIDGGGVPEDEGYITRLQELAGEDYEVLAFGMGGINSRQKRLLMNKLALGYSPDLIILQHTQNDIEPARTPLGSDPNGKPYMLIRSKTDVLIINDFLVPSFPGVPDDANRLILHSALMRALSQQLNSLVSAEYDDINEPITQVIEMKREAGETPFIVVNFPAAIEGSCSIEINNVLKDAVASHSIMYLDLCDRFDPMDVKNLNEPPAGGHYNSEGYRLAAIATKEFIDQNFI